MQKESRFPWWLVCLILFAAMVAYCFLSIPAGRPETVAAGSSETDYIVSLGSGTERDFRSSDGGSEMTGSAETVGSEDNMPEDGTEGAGSGAVPGGETGGAETIPTDEGAVTADGGFSTEGTDAGTVGFHTEEADSENAVAVGPVVGHVHRFVNGVCAECGAQPVFCTDGLPESLTETALYPGTLESHDYTVTAYANHGNGTYHKTLQVYLPYGYDGSEKYDVLFLIPGQGDTLDDWLVKEHRCGGVTVTGKNLLDRMFETGWARPFIVVSLVAETNVAQGLTAGVYQMKDELRNDVLPWVAENYSTWASDSSEAGLSAAREHFALGGLSDGALIALEAGMRVNFDLFGSYMALSGNGEPWVTIAELQNNARFRELQVTCFFACAGTDGDWQAGYTDDGFQYFVQKDERFRENENAFHVDVKGGYEWNVWMTGLCNAAQVLFES